MQIRRPTPDLQSFFIFWVQIEASLCDVSGVDEVLYGGGDYCGAVGGAWLSFWRIVRLL